MLKDNGLMPKLKLAFRLALSNMKIRYAMAVLGPFWITANFIIVVSAIGLIYPSLFGVEIKTYLPFFACGYLVWILFSSTAINSTSAIIGNGGYITERGIAPDVFIMVNMFDQIIILAHTLPIVVLIFILFQAGSLWGFLLCLPGLFLFVIFTFSLSTMIAPFCVRFRDLPKIIESAMFAILVASPILWDPASLTPDKLHVIKLNPFFHLFEAWRVPLLHQTLNIEALSFSAGVTAFTLIGAFLSRGQLARVAIWI